MNRSKLTFAVLAASGALALSACSEETQETAESFATSAADDIKENAEAAGEVIEDAAIVASDKISEGAANARDELADDEAAEAPAAEPTKAPE